MEDLMCSARAPATAVKRQQLLYECTVIYAEIQLFAVVSVHNSAIKLRTSTHTVRLVLGLYPRRVIVRRRLVAARPRTAQLGR